MELTANLAVGLLVILVVFLFTKFAYWKVRGVDFIWAFGLLGNKHRFDATYADCKARGKSYYGQFFITTPVLVVLDLDLIKRIVSVNFPNFHARGLLVDERDPLNSNLFNASGQRWRQLRVKLTPTFTSGKMKMMFQTVVDCSQSMLTQIDADAKVKRATDIKGICRGFTTDVICSIAFGIESDASDEASLFRKYGELIFKPSKSTIMRRRLYFLCPALARFLGIETKSPELCDFFEKLITNIVEYREKNNYRRADFMQMLIDLKNNKPLDEEAASVNSKKDVASSMSFTMKDLIAQSFVFFAAGFETSSTTMVFSLYELAINQRIQDKLRKEIVDVLQKHDGQLTYEALNEMKYLAQVVDETLRKYPPVSILPRGCTEDYQIPEDGLTLKQGTIVVLPVYQIHHDARYYENPETFDPDRFSAENRDKIPSYAYLPFGEGPRICIGLRFGLMQAKIGLLTLLKRYKFTLNEKMPKQMDFNPYSFTLAFKQTVYLDAEELVE